MIQLNELNIWKELNSPYGNSDEIPSLIIELKKTNKKELVDKIIWEYIYHQGSVSENTIVTIPHLLEIAKTTKDINFKIDLLLSVGIVLIGFDEFSNLEEKINFNVSEMIKNRIKKSFLKSIKDFKNLIIDFFSNVNILDESSKRYFLIAYLVTINKHKEAETFSIFSENDEYIFVCPNCNEETFLWNEENILNAYSKDPVVNNNQKKIPIRLNKYNENLKWLEKSIHKININSLKSLIPYFKGSLICHKCNEKNNVFEGIINNIYYEV